MWIERERSYGPWRRGSLFHRERGQREKERRGKRAAPSVHTRKTHSQNHWLGNQEELTIACFYKWWSANSEVLEVHTIHWNQSGSQWFFWGEGGRRPRSRQQTTWCRDPLGCTGEECSPSWSTFGRGYIDFPRTKDPLGAIEWPFNSKRQKLTQRANKLVAAFCCASP